MTPAQGKTIVHDDTALEHGVVSRTIWQGDEDYASMNAALTHDFGAAVADRRQPKTSLEQALVVQRLTDAIYASAERGTAVCLEGRGAER